MIIQRTFLRITLISWPLCRLKFPTTETKLSLLLSDLSCKTGFLQKMVESDRMQNSIRKPVIWSESDLNLRLVEAQLAHLPLELQVPGLIPCFVKGILLSKLAFTCVICRHDMKTLRCPLIRLLTVTAMGKALLKDR